MKGSPTIPARFLFSWCERRQSSAAGALLALSWSDVYTGSHIAAFNLNISPSDAAFAAILILALMALNALFHAGETALSGLRSSRIRELAEAKNPHAVRLQHLHENGQEYFATCQIGFQVARVGIITAAVLISPAPATWLRGPEYGPLTLLVAVVGMIFVVALINLTFVELLFRGVARQNPEVWAARLYHFLRVARTILSPLIRLVGGLGSLFSRRFGVWPLFSPPVVTEEDLRELVDASGASGELIEDEKEMIHSIIEFTDTVAREVMTPRTDIDALEADATAHEVARLIEQTGRSRIPIYKDTIDRIIGIVHAKDLLKALLDGNGSSLDEIMRPALFIPESKDLHQLLTEFRLERTQMAIVQDEFGGTAGLVTIEDVVEEIVGEIVDEYDVEEPTIQQVEPGTWLIHGKMNIDDVNDEIGSNFESDEFDTLGGFVFGLFGRQPSKGEHIQCGDWEFEIAETDGRRVQRVKTQRTPVREERLA